MVLGLNVALLLFNWDAILLGLLSDLRLTLSRTCIQNRYSYDFITICSNQDIIIPLNCFFLLSAAFENSNTKHPHLRHSQPKYALPEALQVLMIVPSKNRLFPYLLYLMPASPYCIPLWFLIQEICRDHESIFF
jgi:hypothetical protein